ncbi:DNA-binding transcriptional regulator UidR [Escherichia coli]|uniref:DNA-binding transcriptional regulator UidR n=1 Tax=Escherichia coli TaxID=562 RepID=UPI001330B384|nr:DNA-binding transcriptional regulator UidR [Escherichia coli]EIM2787313.1 DNA-binding transcriptional regulator UidR [Escherichia coli]HAG8992355.1 TetR/AcrR family transcriptional regulator [Escherichia coli]
MMDNMQTEAQPTRTRILNAAREIFSENGFHSASMKAICKSCAISPGTLYHHFISKEALIQAIILQDQERALARFREPIEGINFVDYMVESIVSLTHEAFGQRALVVEIMAEGMRNPQVAAMLKNKHMTITEFVAQRMRDAQQKGEISPDINTAMTSRLLLDLTYGVLADIEAEDLAREASFAQGLRAMIGGILTAS